MQPMIRVRKMRKDKRQKPEDRVRHNHHASRPVKLGALDLMQEGSTGLLSAPEQVTGFLSRYSHERGYR